MKKVNKIMRTIIITKIMIRKPIIISMIIIMIIIITTTTIITMVTTISVYSKITWMC